MRAPIRHPLQVPSLAGSDLASAALGSSAAAAGALGALAIYCSADVAPCVRDSLPNSAADVSRMVDLLCKLPASSSPQGMCFRFTLEHSLQFVVQTQSSPPSRLPLFFRSRPSKKRTRLHIHFCTGLRSQSCPCHMPVRSRWQSPLRWGRREGRCRACSRDDRSGSNISALRRGYDFQCHNPDAGRPGGPAEDAASTARDFRGDRLELRSAPSFNPRQAGSVD